jgi:hypothetical protein
MKPWLVLLSLFMTIGMPAATPVAAKDVRIETSHGTARLIFGDFSGIPLDLKPLSGADGIDKAEILFANTKNEIWYVVIRLAGPTTRNGRGGHCGAGGEENLVWIKMSHAAILEVRSILYDSCAFSIDAGAMRLTKGGLSVEYSSSREGRTFACTYDNKLPGKGFSVVTTKRDQ